MSRARDVADGALGKIAGTNGQVLTSNGTVWSSQAVPTELPAVGANGNVLTSNGSAWSSQAVPTELPAHGSDGNILTSTGSAWASEANPLPAHSTVGNVLTSTGSAWASQAAAGGAGWTWLAKNDITSNASYSTFDDSKVTNAYTNYAVVMNHVNFGNNSGKLGAFIYANGAWRQGTGEEDYQFHVAEYVSVAGGSFNMLSSGNSWNQSYIRMMYSNTGSSASALGANLVFYFNTRANGGLYRSFAWQGTQTANNQGGGILLGGAIYKGQTSHNITGIRFYEIGGANIARGEFNLYGLAGS